MQSVFEKLVENAKTGTASVLISIIKHKGSTPRGAGAKMVLSEDGSLVGTIGGGALEFVSQREGKTVLETKKNHTKQFSLAPEDVAELGMVCGGWAIVHFQWIDPANLAVQATYQKALQHLKAREDFVLLTQMESGETYVLLPGEAKKAPFSYEDITGYKTQILEDERFVADPFRSAGRALVFGMGHVGAQLVPVLHPLGFHTVALDDRADFLEKERLPLADEIRSVDFTNALADFTVDENDYIVILTRGHLHDYSVLRLAVQTKAGYIGLIGSRNKVAMSLQKLREEGIAECDIARVHAPIGLPLGGNTPEEIAISIAAEMIRVRSGYVQKGQGSCDEKR